MFEIITPALQNTLLSPMSIVNTSYMMLFFGIFVCFMTNQPYPYQIITSIKINVNTVCMFGLHFLSFLWCESSVNSFLQYIKWAMNVSSVLTSSWLAVRSLSQGFLKHYWRLFNTGQRLDRGDFWRTSVFVLFWVSKTNLGKLHFLRMFCGVFVTFVTNGGRMSFVCFTALESFIWEEVGDRHISHSFVFNRDKDRKKIEVRSVDKRE